MHDASFVQVKMPLDSPRPFFVLKDVSSISVFRCPAVDDAEIDQANDKQL